MIAPDTSVLVAAFSPAHVMRDAARRAIASDDRRLIGHAAAETVSVLSRLPEGRRIAANVVVDALAASFRTPWLTLDGDALPAALARITDVGIRGGALYDGLIGLTAESEDALLVTADRRAIPTYETLGVRFELVRGG